MMFWLTISILLFSCYTRAENDRGYHPCHFGPHKYVLLEVRDTMISKNQVRSMEVYQCIRYCCGFRDTSFWRKDLIAKY